MRSNHPAPSRPLLRPGIAVASLIVVAIAAVVVLSWTSSPNAPPAPTATTSPRVAPSSASERGAHTGVFPNVTLALVGTTWKRNQAAALISVENRPVDAYVVGDELISGIKVRSIFPDRVVVAYGDITKTLYVQRSAGRKSTTAAGAPSSNSGPVEGFREKNPDIDPHLLTENRLQAAEDFLRDVKIAPNPRGGFVVQSVEPESVYEKLGVRPGDVIYSIDTPGNRDIDESSIEIAMKQQELQLEVYRNGNFELLHTRIDQ